ncbi:MAG TPA: ABC transporter permease [Verrucomicrobiae bacterium]|nr:ABC transporter permease [Verrucomicrobiae bacterium]
MQAYLTLVRREMGAYLLSMTGYIIVAAVTFLLGLSFVVLMVKLQQDSTPIPLTEIFYNTQFFWLILLLATPVMTMRLFAHEKFSGTFETLMTAPVSELEVVLAKFSAALIFYTLAWVPLLACLLVVRHFTNDPSAFDVGVMGSTFLGIILVGAMFVSIGLCSSALTKSQVAAAMISLLSGGFIFCVGFLADRVAAQTGWKNQFLASLAFFDQMHDFVRGIIDTRAVVLYLSLTLFFLFVTLRIVESRRWK